MTTSVPFSLKLPPPEAFTELPGMRGLRIARVGQADGKTLEVIDGVKGVVIPHMQSPGGEKGRVLEGKIQFTQDGTSRVLSAGDTWEVGPMTPQGPHIFLAPSRVVILREGKSAFDPQ